MSTERSIMDSILRRKHDRLNEASFTAGNSTYTSAFGRYYKDGEPITRDDYFKAKEVDSVVDDRPAPKTIEPKFSADSLPNSKSKKYKDGTVTSFSADESLDKFIDALPKEYSLINSKGTKERGTLVYSDKEGNTVWINKDGENSKLWIYNEPKHATKETEKSQLDEPKADTKKSDRKSYKESSDDELLTYYRAGDSNAANALIKRYENLVRYVAKSYFASGVDNDDLTQEGLMGVYDAMSSYVPGKNKNFKQFAILAAKRNIMNAIDKQNNLKNSPMKSYSGYETVDKEKIDTIQGNPELEYAKKENAEKVAKFMKDKLTDHENEVLDLVLKGYKTKEIMDILGVSNKSVENAKERIKKKVTQWQASQNESVSLDIDVPAILERDLNLIESTPKGMYDKYLQKHRRMVLEVFESIMRPALVNDGYPEEVLKKIEENILTHDDSKYNDDEWDAYQNYFYDKENHPRSSEEFSVAWNHHQKRNPHHWQYWCLVNDVDDPQIQPVDMPLVYVVEMLCDWHAAGQHYGNTGKDWYDKQNHRMILSENTRFMIENYIDLLK